MKKFWEEYKDDAIMLVVYIREAHAAKAEQTADDAGWKAVATEEGEAVVFYQPKTFEERRKLAETACTFWEMPIPALVDTIEPSAGGIYKARPNRFYLLDKDGKIFYEGGGGPGGCNMQKGEVAFRNLLGLPQEGAILKATGGAAAGRGSPPSGANRPPRGERPSRSRPTTPAENSPPGI